MTDQKRWDVDRLTESTRASVPMAEQTGVRVVGRTGRRAVPRPQRVHALSRAGT